MSRGEILFLLQVYTIFTAVLLGCQANGKFTFNSIAEYGTLINEDRYNAITPIPDFHKLHILVLLVIVTLNCFAFLDHRPRSSVLFSNYKHRRIGNWNTNLNWIVVLLN